MYVSTGFQLSYSLCLILFLPFNTPFYFEGTCNSRGNSQVLVLRLISQTNTTQRNFVQGEFPLICLVIQRVEFQPDLSRVTCKKKKERFGLWMASMARDKEQIPAETAMSVQASQLFPDEPWPQHLSEVFQTIWRKLKMNLSTFPLLANRKNAQR